jgi:putative ABC transport system ATP-binding protein
MSRLPEAKRDRLRAETIGYVFQTFNLLQGYTALENVLLGMMFGKGVDTARAKAILERVGMSDRMQYQPRQLSVGQQQRVALARALANHPKLVLADEPTGNLDPHHAREALAMIREICRENGAALLLVSHDEGVLAQFERAVDFAEINVCLKGARS